MRPANIRTSLCVQLCAVTPVGRAILAPCSCDGVSWLCLHPLMWPKRVVFQARRRFCVCCLLLRPWCLPPSWLQALAAIGAKGCPAPVPGVCRAPAGITTLLFHQWTPSLRRFRAHAAATRPCWAMEVLGGG